MSLKLKALRPCACADQGCDALVKGNQKFCSVCKAGQKLKVKPRIRPDGTREEFYRYYKLSTGKVLWLNENSACDCYQANFLTDEEWDEYEAIPACHQRVRREGMPWQEFLQAKPARVL